MALKVADHEAESVHTYLRERELVTHVYREIRHFVQFDDGQEREALVYVVDQSHDQYARGLNHGELLRHIRQGEGVSGKNTEYVINTVRHLQTLGIHDQGLEDIVADLNCDGDL